MDSAARLDTTNPVFSIRVASDPVFTEIATSDEVYVRGSQEFISILVRPLTFKFW